jgi:hypothetical protein
VRNFGRVLGFLAALSVGGTPALMSSCGGSKGMGHYMTSKAVGANKEVRAAAAHLVLL